MRDLSGFRVGLGGLEPMDLVVVGWDGCDGWTWWWWVGMGTTYWVGWWWSCFSGFLWGSWRFGVRILGRDCFWMGGRLMVSVILMAGVLEIRIIDCYLDCDFHM